MFSSAGDILRAKVPNLTASNFKELVFMLLLAGVQEGGGPSIKITNKVVCSIHTLFQFSIFFNHNTGC